MPGYYLARPRILPPGNAQYDPSTLAPLHRLDIVLSPFPSLSLSLSLTLFVSTTDSQFSSRSLAYASPRLSLLLLLFLSSTFAEAGREGGRANLVRVTGAISRFRRRRWGRESRFLLISHTRARSLAFSALVAFSFNFLIPWLICCAPCLRD